MKKVGALKLISMLMLVCLSMSSCQAIADIFKAGVWVGVIVVVIIIVVIFWLIGKSKN